MQLVAALPLNFPEPQYVHEDAAGPEYLPPRQSTHEDAPEELDEPAGQLAQLDCSLVVVK